MESYMDILENLGVHFPIELAIDMVINLLSSSHHHLIMKYSMKILEKTSMELHGMLKITEVSMVKTQRSTSSTPFLSIGHKNVAKKKKFSHSKGKGKTREGMYKQGLMRNIESNITLTTDPKETICFYYEEMGHWNESVVCIGKSNNITLNIDSSK